MATHPHDSPELRKARGAFFTPESVARYVTEWAVRSPTDRVLEPSCGEAAFLLEAGGRLDSLGAPKGLPGLLHGAELHAHSADIASGLLRDAGHESKIAVGDFLRREPVAAYDAVIGNPPYGRQESTAATDGQGPGAQTLAKIWLSSVCQSR